MLNTAEMNGCALYTKNTVTFALVIVIAYKRAYNAERVILEEHTTRFINIAVKERADNVGYLRAYRAAGDAHRIFAVETSARLGDYIKCHYYSCFPETPRNIVFYELKHISVIQLFYQKNR